jgi:hypothetical protein
MRTQAPTHIRIFYSGSYGRAKARNNLLVTCMIDVRLKQCNKLSSQLLNLTSKYALELIFTREAGKGFYAQSHRTASLYSHNLYYNLYNEL